MYTNMSTTLAWSSSMDTTYSSFISTCKCLPSPPQIHWYPSTDWDSHQADSSHQSRPLPPPSWPSYTTMTLWLEQCTIRFQKETICPLTRRLSPAKCHHDRHRPTRASLASSMHQLGVHRPRLWEVLCVVLAVHRRPPTLQAEHTGPIRFRRDHSRSTA